MMDEKRFSGLLKIPEAAQYLNVTRRWIYRRIWSGDLPASKVGGLYFIRRQDIDSLLEQGKLGGTGKLEPEALQSALKCGHCFRLLENDSLIGEVCRAENCEQLICTQCVAEGDHFCVEHEPNKEQLWEQALGDFRQGGILLLVKASQARLREVNFIQRFQTRLSGIGTLQHPLTEELIPVSNWDAYLELGDEQAEVMRLMNKVVLDADWLAKVPLNAWARYDLPVGKKQRGGPVAVLARTFSPLAEMLQKGFATCALSAEVLTARLLSLGEEAQRSQILTLVLLASTTGWDQAARDLVQGKEAGTAFAHRWMLVYLYDMETRQIIYNRQDSRLRGFAEMFTPLLPSEEVDEAAAALEKEMGFYDSLTMANALEIFSYSQATVRKAFELMASSGHYALTEIPNLGLAIVRI